MARANAVVALIAPIFTGDPVHEPVHESPPLLVSADYATSSSVAWATLWAPLAARCWRPVWQADSRHIVSTGYQAIGCNTRTSRTSKLICAASLLTAATYGLGPSGTFFSAAPLHLHARRRVGLAATPVSRAAQASAACCRVLIVGGFVVADLLVVGLDLVTLLEVHAEDRETWEWREKGHNGDQTLVCLACYQGADLPDGPQVVALVPRGRVCGVRCRHFAHPPGMAPPGGRHNSESLDHSDGKQALRRWAAKQGFAARVEAWAADGRRRSDVEVIMPGGVRVAIELQCSKITDAEWIARHEDYVRAGITDVWLWHRRIEVPRVVFQYDQLGLAFRSGDGRGRTAVCPPRSCCRQDSIGAPRMRPRALAAMSGRPARHFVDAAGIRAADLAWDRASSRGGCRTGQAGGRRGP